MSWMKRRGQPSPNPANPGVQMYNPNQHSTPQQPYQQWPQQQQQQTQQQYNNDWYNQSKVANKTPPLQQHQQYSQPPQPATTNTWNWNQPPQVQQQPQYQQQSYNQFTNTQPHQQPNYYQNNSGYNIQRDYNQQQQPQQYAQPNYYGAAQTLPSSQNKSPTVTNQSQDLDPWNWDLDDNTNSNNPQDTQNITDSFSNNQSWNWSVEESSSSQSLNTVDKTDQDIKLNSNDLAAAELEHQQLQNLPAAVQRIKSENLTPQWSIESQVSQDSSEDVLLTSESDNRSNHLSQSSTTSRSPSRPESTQDDRPVEIKSEPINHEYYLDNVDQRLQELSLNNAVENKEIVSPEVLQQEVIPQPPPPPLKDTTPPPPPKMTPPLLNASSENKNPYKRNTALGHKSASSSKLLTPQPPAEPFLQTTPSAFSQPSRSTDTLGVNLETLPENSERPDQVETIPNIRKTSIVQQWPENLEIAPINDRNQYLETGQLSDADLPVYNQSGNDYQRTDNLDSLPPPGLRRLVLGQTEQSDQPIDQTDLPPVRMVLGSTVPTVRTPRRMADVFQPAEYQNNEEPPAGLHRMVPGESSSPESHMYQSDATVFQTVNFDDGDNYVSETELNQLGVTLVSQRSATIGADTPPVPSNQQIDDYSSTSSMEPIREGAVGIEKKEADNTTDDNPDTSRRDIDGGHDEIRDQTDGQNTTDAASVAAAPEKHRSRNYTSDSDHEQPKERHNRSVSPNSRYEKDRAYYRDRPRERTPERYRTDKTRRKPKDRRYEDDTDYYSDKERSERRRREEREEYERKYNSLRKDKRRPPDRRDYDDRRSDYYYNYNRYEDEYYNRSRPSSRTDSMHDSYRERNRPEHDRRRDHRRPKEPYNPYYQGFSYDPYSPYYQQYQYQYYENLRRTNPQAYDEWYRKYYQQAATAAARAPGYATEDRASVHSGRSSANEELQKDRLMDNTDSLLEDNASQRLTPAKFYTAHVKASIASGKFVNILPNYPADGQPPIVEIINLQHFFVDDEDYKELNEFPGPLTKGVTHKKTVIEYCENMIKKAHQTPHMTDVDSYVLMWELLILLLRQNGMVVGTDIAELLMKNRTFENSRQSVSSTSSSTQHIDAIGDKDTARASPAIHYKEDYITDKFREYLIYGSGKEALEWAMKHGLWGHALFLASKLDKRTYANVMMRFANGLTMNDPLQTLYQLLSGRQPAAVTSVVDDKWGDWRPHLAMILSNTSQRPDLDRKAITTLGDTLYQRGSLYASHFCYLMAQVEFGRFGTPNVKLVLLGSAPNKTFASFATNEAIFMTEIYEYACSLSDPAFLIPEFQVYKYLMATRMADYGLLEKGLSYLERVAVNIKENPSRVKPSLVQRVCTLADRLKYYDPIQDDDLDSSRSDSSWLADLKIVLNDYNMGLITHQSSTNLTSIEPELQPTQEQQPTEQQWQQQEYYKQDQQPWQPEQQPNIDYSQPQSNYQDNDQQQQQPFENYQEQQFWSQQQQQPPVWQENAEDTTQQQQQQAPLNEPPQTDYWNTAAQSEEPAILQQPQISMPNQTTKSKNYFDESDDIAKQSSTTKSATPAKKQATAPATNSTGWFGGIWSKLSLRPKNQMKLPDDKNPTIVWDSEKKRWVNLEEDNTDAGTELKPPPKMTDMFANRSMPPPSNSGPASLPAQTYSNPPPPNAIQPNLSKPLENAAIPTDNIDTPRPPSQSNIFKLQRNRNIKKAYVDVFNPGGVKTAASVPPAEMFGAALPSNGAQMNYFVPTVNSDPNAPTDFLTTQAATTEEHSQTGGPPMMMYNPNQFSNQHGGY